MKKIFFEALAYSHPARKKCFFIKIHSNVFKHYNFYCLFAKKYNAAYDRNMKQELITTSKEETIRSGKECARRLSGKSLVILSGDLGAGKTTFIQGMLEEFEIEGPYTSPTFVIMKQYDVRSESHPDIRRVYHTDAYRIGSSEILSLGWEEWLDDPVGVVLLEWPERVADIIPEDAVKISLEWLDESKRKIVIEE